MSTTQEDLRTWFKRGLQMKSTHMIVVCDTFNYEDYPVYVSPKEDVRIIVAQRGEQFMQKIMEVYDLREPMEPQVSSGYRVFNYARGRT